MKPAPSGFCLLLSLESWNSDQRQPAATGHRRDMEGQAEGQGTAGSWQACSRARGPPSQASLPAPDQPSALRWELQVTLL